MVSNVENKKKKTNKVVAYGVVNILAGFNNTIVSVCDENGNVLSWSSSGKMKFKGAQKSTPYVAQVVSANAVKIAIEKYGLKTVSVVLNGIGAGRDNAVRAVQESGVIVNAIVDITPILHNGCRAPKRRRV